ncbi:acetate--CoA ligase family protein [Sphingomonas canadensis]|uniref:Acetate--CoA ligase family protein n=1 Tax=Sphingomonas canadensis TaxID=1219257 RepID=A0ABW3H355_9SPHN|nr:acetate--CoA ligase family protein [Sphingomonas canadensis]MCW3835653.1 acetate--CoA ligase family protein [Sphingomonas canadensis]
MKPARFTTAQVRRLLSPRSVAIVGASDKPGALGASCLQNLLDRGFSGDIHLINPNRDRIGDRPCLKSIDDLPEGVDAAVLAIPGPAVLATVEALAKRKVGSAVIFSAGFGEGGEEGKAAQRALARIAHEAGMVVEGPNCLGLTNLVDGVALSFIEMPGDPLGGRPGVGIVSQSGAMAVVLATTLHAKGLGVSVSVSTGNEAASGAEDYIDYLIDDPHTQVIALIIEQFRDAGRFLELARRAAQAGKPIVLLHPGRSAAARESAATHTGAMAGDWDVMRVKVTAAGVTVVENLEELGDATDIALRAGRVPAGGTVVLAESGAFKALTLDLCDGIGLPLPRFGAETHAALRAAMPDFIEVSNPLDLTAQALVDPGIYRRTLEPLLADPAISSIVIAIIQTEPKTAMRKFPPILETLSGLERTKPVIYAGLDEGAEVPAEPIAELRRMGVPYFPTADRAFRAIARLAGAGIAATDGQAPVALDLPVGGGAIPEYRSKALLAEAGISFPRGRFAATLAEGKAAAAEVGYPVVLKAQAAALSHKSDAGGVKLNIADDAALEAAWTAMEASVEAYSPGLKLDGMLIEGMGERGLEFIIGARNDADWGPVILVGFGGVQAEVLKDVRLIEPGLPHDAIVAELRKLKSAALMDGWRGSPAVDVDAVAGVVTALGRVLMGTPGIREIDLNPVVAYPKGAVALDALIYT